MIVQRHEEFAAVVRIDDADLVGRRKMPLAGKAAAGKDQPRVAGGNFHGDADGDELRFPGLKGDGRVQTGAQIRARGEFRPVDGKPGVRPELLYVNPLHGFLRAASRRPRE